MLLCRACQVNSAIIMLSVNTDIVILGAGPVGLFTIFQAGMLGMRVCVVDGLEFIGGQCAALYPEKPIYDIPAHPVIDGADLIAKLQEQAAKFNPQYLLGQRVEELVRHGEEFVLNTSVGNRITGKIVVIAAGGGAFTPNRPPIAGIEQYEGKSVLYNVKNIEVFRDKTVAIAGGGDSAADWAISIAEVAKKIYLIHRRQNLRCMAHSMMRINELAQEGKIEMVIPYQVIGVSGANQQLEAITLTDIEQLERKDLQIDFFLPFFGLSSSLGPIAAWGLNLNKKYIKVESGTMSTSEKGIYAVGDIADYEHKLRLILTGFAEAAAAMHDAYKIVFPNKVLHFEYSTTKFGK